jgi:exopolysaccharide biosynthesis protein
MEGVMKRKVVPHYLALILVISIFLMDSPVVGAQAAYEATPPTSIAATGRPASTATPAVTVSKLPAALPAVILKTSYFTTTEIVTISPKKDHWRYTSPTLYIDIIKVRNKAKDLTYFVADIRMQDPKAFRSGVISGLSIPEVIAKKFSAVYAQNGDFFTLEKNLKGIIIRNGKVLSERKGADTMALLPDGTLKIFAPGQTTAKKLLGMGVKDTYSFGPTLIKDGVLRTSYNAFRNHGKNPRSGFGMVEKGHYIGIVVGGRNPGYSVGVTYLDFAKLFKAYGCKQAYCFDGGASASMVFMGTALPINVKMTNSNKLTKRRVPDIFIIGKSALVPKK